MATLLGRRCIFKDCTEAKDRLRVTLTVIVGMKGCDDDDYDDIELKPFRIF